MSAKSIITGVLVVAAIAVNFIPGVGQVLSAGLITAITSAGVGAGLSFISSALLGPSMPKVPRTDPRDRLSVTMDPSAPRKIVFGNTAMATDLRYQTFTGADQDYYHQIIACASHEVQSIDEIWLDNEVAWTSGGGVQGRYANYLTVTTRTVGTSGNGIAIDGTWTASCTLTGCAYVYLKYKLSGNDDDEQSPFAGGVTTRMTIRGKGAKVYDPRLDSTVTGGSGSQRADDQSTWAWNDNASRNPALQELWYRLGWKINGKLAVGMGMPKARTDLASYITAANICDESVALNGGGSEPRYRSDGVLSEGDDRRAVIETLCATMNSILRDAGGRLAQTVLKDDLATPAAALSEDDVLGDEEWVQTPELHACFNIVRGSRIDPSDTALYQPVDFPEVALASLDGIDRIDTVQYMMVQSNGQAQRLAKQRLQRNQYQGRYSCTGLPGWWRVSVGNVVQLSHQGLGWSNKLFRVAGQTIARTGETKVALIEENAAIYAWDNNEAAAVTPGAPTIYDPANSPLLGGIQTIQQQAPQGNLLKDITFRLWTLSAGAARARRNATGGYAKGTTAWYLELSPSPSLVRDAKAPLYPVQPGFRYYFAIAAQRGATLGTGSRLNAGGDWIAADKVTVVAAAAEVTQIAPASLTAGAAPKDFTWNDVAPAGAAFFRMRVYTPALASSSGTFRVENPRITLNEASADVTSWVDGVSDVSFTYDSTGATADTGQLPAGLDFKLMNAAGAITSGVTWTYNVVSGTVNGFTSSSGTKSMTGSGTGTLTVSSLGSNSATVKVTATYGGATRTKTITLSKVLAGTPIGGGGGAGSTIASKTTGFTSISTSSFADVTGSLTGSPSGTTATVNVALSVKPPRNSVVDQSWTIEAKVQRLIGATWTDKGSVQSAGANVHTDGEGIQYADAASFNFSVSDTGLTAGVSTSWRVVVRISVGNTGITFTISGTVSVVA